MSIIVKISDLWGSVSNQVTRSDLFGQSLSGNCFSDQGAHDTHHSGTSLVEFHIQLVLQFITFQKVGNKGASVSGSVVSRVVGSRPDSQLTYPGEEEDLGNTGKGNGEKSHHTIRDIRESNSHFLGKVSREFDSSVVEQHSDNGSHGNASMFALDSPTALEVGVEGRKFAGGVLGRVQPSQRIVEAQRSGNTERRIQWADALAQGRRTSLCPVMVRRMTKSELQKVQQHREQERDTLIGTYSLYRETTYRGSLGRSKCSGRADKERGKGELHLDRDYPKCGHDVHLQRSLTSLQVE